MFCAGNSLAGKFAGFIDLSHKITSSTPDNLVLSRPPEVQCYLTASTEAEDLPKLTTSRTLLLCECTIMILHEEGFTGNYPGADCDNTISFDDRVQFHNVTAL